MSFKPNAQQAAATQALNEIFNPTVKAPMEFGFYGFAGTGKTTTIVNAIVEAGNARDIILCAPTHKAAGVLNLMLANTPLAGRLEARTLASVLKMSKRYKEGESMFIPNIEKAAEEAMGLNKYSERRTAARLLIVDEASMITRKQHMWIKELAATAHLSVIYLGDRLQLPPVDPDAKKSYESPCVLIEDRAELTQVMRNKGVIASAVAGVRDGIADDAVVTAESASDASGEVIAMTDGKAFMKALAADIIAGNDAYGVSYTNKAVSALNKFVDMEVRKANNISLEDPFYEGQVLVARNAITQTACMKDPVSFSQAETVFTTRQRFKVVKYEVGEQHGFGCAWVYAAGSKFAVIVDNAEQRRYWAELKRLKTAAQNARGYDAKRAWDQYHLLNESFADVKLAYAGTVHSTQGDSIDSVYVIEREIMTCHDRATRDRMLYVAYSRARKKLTLLKGVKGS